MTRPWEIPASAHLDPRWNTALDLAAAGDPLASPAKVAAAWDQHGPDWVLARLREMAAGGDEEAAREAG